ncbi:MAG: hypothetical protein KDI88_18880, partial [Gammaproteobacteria bacterium]|nr:hypothetical protein [Gammaproteobacteria bacterium]
MGDPAGQGRRKHPDSVEIRRAITAQVQKNRRNIKRFRRNVHDEEGVDEEFAAAMGVFALKRLFLIRINTSIILAA